MHLMKRRAACVLVALMTTGCGSSVSTPTIPTTPPATATPCCPTGPYTISGTVQELTPHGARPVPGVAVDTWIGFGGLSGYSNREAHGPLQTDAMGRYTLQNVPEGATVWVTVSTPGLVQQCAATAVHVHADQVVDVPLVSTANLSASRTFLPPPAPGYRFVSGSVFKANETGTRPAAGAYVALGLFTAEEAYAAATFSDAGGHYLLCGLPDADSVLITASFSGGFVSVSVPPGVSAGVDLVIP